MLSRFFNGGKGGAPSSYIHQCVYKFAPKDADLVTVEFALNDKQPGCGVNTPVRSCPAVCMMRDVRCCEQNTHNSPQKDNFTGIRFMWTLGGYVASATRAQREKKPSCYAGVSVMPPATSPSP